MRPSTLPSFLPYNFSVTMATTYSIYRLEAVTSIKILAIENMSPHFSAHAYYGQTAGWIKIPTGSPLRKRAQQPPFFGPCLLWPNGWIDQDTTWYVYTEVRLGSGDIVLDRDPAAPLHPRKATPTFRPTALAGIPASPYS